MADFNNLPLEIKLEILSRIPAQSILDCKLVCGNWKNIVHIASNDRSFSQKHLHHLNHPSTAAEDSCKLSFLASSWDELYYFEYDQNQELTTPIERIRKINPTSLYGGFLIGSLNGLVCLAIGRPDMPDYPVWIFNPFTKEHLLLPKIRGTDEYDKYADWSFGFGYLSATNEYKVVGIYWSRKTKFIEVYIYNLGSGKGWRDLGKLNIEFRLTPSCEQGSFANGAIYWFNAEVKKILTFDLIEEKFSQHLAPPPLPPNTDFLINTLGILDGFLYIAVYDEVDDCFDIGLLKKKNDSHDKKVGEEHQSWIWSKEFRVYETHSLAVTKSGGVLTYTDSDDSEYALNISDTKASTPKRLVDFEERVRRVFPHKNTFVSMKELGEEAAYIM